MVHFICLKKKVYLLCNQNFLKYIVYNYKQYTYLCIQVVRHTSFVHIILVFLKNDLSFKDSRFFFIFNLNLFSNMNVHEIIKKFDTDTLDNDDIIQLRKLYQSLTKEDTQNENERYNSDIYNSLDTCKNCLRIAVNQIRYIISKKQIL